jgi:hypothetical protein
MFLAMVTITTIKTTAAIKTTIKTRATCHMQWLAEH